MAPSAVQRPSRCGDNHDSPPEPDDIRQVTSIWTQLLESDPFSGAVSTGQVTLSGMV